MKRLLTLGILTVFLAAGLAPLALADPTDHKDKRESNEKNETKEHHNKAAKPKASFSLDLKGSGTQDNRSFTFELNGTVSGREHSKDGNVTKFGGRGTVHVVVKNGNGTVVREGNIKVQIKAQRHHDGNWTWHLETVGKKGKGMPRLNLRGEATPDGATAWTLKGKGKIVFKGGDEDEATHVKVTATGRIARA